MIDVAEDLDRSVVLEQQVHFNGYAPDVLKNSRLLHICGIRAEAIEAVSGQVRECPLRAHGVVTYMS